MMRLRNRHVAALCSVRLRFLSSEVLRRNAEELGLRLKSDPLKLPEMLEMRRQVPENAYYTKKIMQLAKLKDWSAAKKIFNERPKNTIFCTAMISVAERCRRYEEGLEIVAMMRRESIEFSAVTYGVLMTLYARLGLHREARDLWSEMLEKGIHATKPAATGLLNAIASTGNVESVEVALEAVRASGILPDRGHYGCLLKACRVSMDVDRIFEILDQMDAAAQAASVVEFTLAMAVCQQASIEGILQPSKARQEATRLVAQMVCAGVNANEFFVETHVSALLGRDLKQLQDGRVGASNLSKDAVEAAAVALKEAREKGVRVTRLLEVVWQQLQQESTSDSSGSNDGTGSNTQSGQVPLASMVEWRLDQQSDEGLRFRHLTTGVVTSDQPAKGWVEVYSEMHARSYYWDPNTGTTTWQRPGP